MKKLFLVGLAFALFLNFLPSLKAQTAVARFNVDVEKPLPVLNEKAEINFKREFKHIKSANWIEKEDGYRAKFDERGISYMVDYDKSGNWLSTIKNYDESHLDSRIGNAVKTAFLGYFIVHVTEIKKGRVIAYMVKIENQKLLKTIRVIDGEIDVYESYVKG